LAGEDGGAAVGRRPSFSGHECLRTQRERERERERESGLVREGE
jgi:hypothetical protein